MSNSNSFTLSGSSGRYVAFERKSVIDTTGMGDDQRTSIPGVSSFHLADGRELNMKDEDTFVLVNSGEELKRIGK